MSDQTELARREMNQSCVDLMVSVGMIDAIIERFPIEVQQNFGDKITDTSAILQNIIAEFHGFGEAYDDSVDG